MTTENPATFVIGTETGLIARTLESLTQPGHWAMKAISWRHGQTKNQ
jgi:hypothetical protein